MGTPTSAEGAIDEWKRLRALTDVVQEQQKEGEHLDRKVRFALIVTGLLNSAVVLGMRGHGTDAVAGGLLLALVLVDAYFFAHVIAALTPRIAAAGGSSADPPGLRSTEAIARADPEGYRRAWQEAGPERLQAELAGQAYVLGSTNAEKAVMVRRLFLSLYAMTASAATSIAWTALT